MELLLSDLLGNYEKPTNQLTNIRGQRVVKLSKENYEFLYIFGKQNIYSFDAEHLENHNVGLFDLICMDILRNLDYMIILSSSPLSMKKSNNFIKIMKIK